MTMKDKEKITIKQLFKTILEIPIDKTITYAINDLKTEGYSETGIVFGVIKSLDKILKFKNDSRFIGVLKNEVRKNAYKINDPRWEKYNNRKRNK